MEAEVQANSPQVEEPRGQAVQPSKETVLGKVPVSTRQNLYRVNDIVYFTAFTKEDNNTLYVCMGKVTKVPDGKDHKAYRVIVTAVGDRPIGGKPSTTQAALLGRALNKRTRELHKEMGPIMLPKGWITSEVQGKGPTS